ncbi:MAG TPA: NAD-dependent epimerase/dehydratase family protein [Phycisphaerales bacterium]|nr:NAD-dependent epimerase/dehydratase family protein [Phycisphaerales bacterium]
MPPTRRTFLRASVVTGLAAGAAGLLGPAGLAAPRSVRAPLRLLILGGTGFLGPAIVAAARARGHTITLFNRGKTEKRTGHTFPDLEHLYGDRDPKVGQGLAALRDRDFDAAIDTSGYVPRIVRASAELLAPNIKQYIFVSSVSVYADNRAPGQDEAAPLATIPDPGNEDFRNPENYGPLKALSEQAAEEAMPGRVANVRPGLIVGPGDPTDRFTYWPVRVAAAGTPPWGSEVLAPGAPADPIQVIDVRDLADFLVTLAERGAMGPYNAVGPAGRLTMGALLEACVAAARATAPAGAGGAGSKSPTLTWVPADFLEKHNVSAWQDMPVWIPADQEHAGFATRSNARAVADGMKFRPIDTTVRDTLAWWPGELARRKRVTAELLEAARQEGKEPPKMADPEKLRAGISPEREQEVLTAWHARAVRPSPPG